MSVTKVMFRSMDVGVDGEVASFKWVEGKESEALVSFGSGETSPGKAWHGVSFAHAAIQAFLDEFPLAVEGPIAPRK